MLGSGPSGTCMVATWTATARVEATFSSAPSRVVAARVVAARVVLATVATVQEPTGHAGSTGATVNRSLERSVVRCQPLVGRHRLGSPHILGREAILSDPPGKKKAGRNRRPQFPIPGNSRGADDRVALRHPLLGERSLFHRRPQPGSRERQPMGCQRSFRLKAGIQTLHHTSALRDCRQPSLVACHPNSKAWAASSSK